MSALDGTAAVAATSLVLAMEASELSSPPNTEQTAGTVNEAAGIDW
jgi:hypothetical protein